MKKGMESIMYIFISELKRAVCSKKFLIAVIIGIIAQIAGVLSMTYKELFSVVQGTSSDEAMRNMFNKYILWYFSTEVSCFSVPLICCIPFSASLIEDRKSNYINFISIRTSYKKYIKAKIASCFTSGFLAVFISTVIFYVIISFTPYHDNPTNIAGFMRNIYINNPEVYLIIYALICSLMGGVYALMGLAVSTKVKSQAASIVSPLIYYYVGIYVFSLLGLVGLEPGSVNCFFARPNVTAVYIFGQLVFYFAVSVIFILRNENRRGCYD